MKKWERWKVKLSPHSWSTAQPGLRPGSLNTAPVPSSDGFCPDSCKALGSSQLFRHFRADRDFRDDWKPLCFRFVNQGLGAAPVLRGQNCSLTPGEGLWVIISRAHKQASVRDEEGLLILAVSLSTYFRRGLPPAFCYWSSHWRLPYPKCGHQQEVNILGGRGFELQHRKSWGSQMVTDQERKKKSRE